MFKDKIMTAPASTITMTAHPRPTLDLPEVSELLVRLHKAARRDWIAYLRALPGFAWRRLSGQSLWQAATPAMANAYIPMSEDQGRFMYQIARLIKARTIVEYGTSFGISSIYLAAAACENEGRFIGSELVASKAAIARRNLDTAGLGPWSEVREGDAMETLARIDTPVDFLLLDGWKDNYTEVLAMMRPKLSKGAVVVADDLDAFPRKLAPFKAYIRDPANGFESVPLHIGDGIEFAVYHG